MNRENLQPEFPKTWLWFADDFLPGWVKRNYSPSESWKKKPFSTEDAKFFLKGIRELSDLFTDERPGSLPDYFSHARFRSSYFLYFVPLQAGKFCSLYSRHLDAIRSALAHGREDGTMTIVDLGAGPGTASLALLLLLVELAKTEKLPEKIRFRWVDQNAGILREGKRLALEVIEHFPELQGRVTIEFDVKPWKPFAKNWREPLHLLLVGHLLNESGGRAEDFFAMARNLRGGGALFVEPAEKRSSQGLSQIRDEFFEGEIFKRDGTSLWGPCLHAEACPLAQGRDWCHFSIRLKTPGKWFEFFSKGLGSAREWQKYSYVWFAAPDAPAPAAPVDIRRVVSDPLVKPSDATAKQVLICEPERPGRYDLKGLEKYWRGDLLNLKARAPVGPRPSRFAREDEDDQDERPLGKKRGFEPGSKSGERSKFEGRFKKEPRASKRPSSKIFVKKKPGK